MKKQPIKQINKKADILVIFNRWTTTKYQEQSKNPCYGYITGGDCLCSRKTCPIQCANNLRMFPFGDEEFSKYNHLVPEVIAKIKAVKQPHHFRTVQLVRKLILSIISEVIKQSNHN